MGEYPVVLLGPEVRRPTIMSWLDAHLPAPSSTTTPHLWVPPHLVHLTAQAQDQGLVIGSTAGFPYGQHDTLLKAAEARLAVQQGAGAIALALSAELWDDPNAALSEVVAVREAVPHPVELHIFVPSRLSAACTQASHLADVVKNCALAGVDGVILRMNTPPEGIVEILPVGVWVDDESCAGEAQARGFKAWVMSSG